MKKMTERILQIIFKSPRIVTSKKSHPFDYVGSKKGIMRELMISRESGSLIGLIAPVLGQGMFLVSVSSIESTGSIVFRKYDFRDRRLLSAGSLSIDDVEAVCPFVMLQQADYHAL